MKIKQHAVKKTVLLVAGFFMMTLADLNSIPASAIGVLAEDNDVIVEDATDDPAITFFVHGLGGHASDWSNTFSTNGTVRYFEKDPDSLIEKMRNTTSPAMNLYRINTSGYTPTDMDDNYLDYSYASLSIAQPDVNVHEQQIRVSIVRRRSPMLFCFLTKRKHPLRMSIADTLK